MKRTLEASAVMKQGKAHAEPINMQKRIGSTTFKVSIHFSNTSQETAKDKLLQLIKREVGSIA